MFDSSPPLNVHHPLAKRNGFWKITKMLAGRILTVHGRTVLLSPFCNR
jgi:hypothetical protein